MKSIKVTTYNTPLGISVHEVLGDKFGSSNYDSKSDPEFITCIYYCSQTAANKALCTTLKKSIRTITTYN